MFTVTVSNLPEECSEEELIAHFNKICPQHKIANISMAYNNAQEIEECVKRGDLIRGKVRAVHVSSHCRKNTPFVCGNAEGCTRFSSVCLFVL